MIVCKTREELSACLSDINGKIGFVPTMGALHEGHLSLIRKSKTDNDFTICSVFVNPTQFNDPKDFEKYPNTIDADITKLNSVGCDLLFLPQVNDMYKRKNVLQFNFGTLENVMEGAMRPGHFNGVGTIVAKLFHLIPAHKAYFGQKDLQQFAIINELVEALSFPIELEMCPIVREENGLAMSSRNERLSPEDRKNASILYKSLQTLREAIKDEVEPHLSNMEAELRANSDFKLEYLSVVDQLSLQSIKKIDPTKKTAICIAAFFGEVRLIDNLVF